MRNVLIVFVLLVVIVGGILVYKFAASGKGYVVIYVAQDEQNAKPYLERFEKETGIEVRAKYDTEADKTVGHVERIRKEKDNPQCDIHWNNEPMHTVNLAKEGLYQPYVSKIAGNFPDTFKDPDGLWMGFAARARVIIRNTNNAEMINGLMDLADPKYKGKIAIANPRAGSTQTHLAALYSVWGKDKFVKWIEDMKNNDLKVLGSNGQTAKAVARGEMMFALTDTDDVFEQKDEENKPVDLIFPDKDGEGTLLFPNTLAVVKGAPNLENAKILYEWILNLEPELAKKASAQIPLNKNVKAPEGRYSISDIKALAVNWKKIAEVRAECVEWLQKGLIEWNN